MIRFQCPNCEKKLSVQDALAGRLAVCPACKQKVRIPAAEEPEEEEEAATEKPRARTRPKGEEIEERPRRPLRRRDEEEEEEDEQPRRRQRDEEEDEEEEDERPRRRRRDEDDENEEEDERPRRKAKDRRKKKKRRAASGPLGMQDPYVLAVSGVLLLGLLSAIAAFFVPVLSIVPLGLGAVTAFAGGVWFLIVAFSDDPMQGILCFLCGPYSLYYLITHFEECKRPFYLQCIGSLIIFLGFASASIRASKGYAERPGAEVRMYSQAYPFRSSMTKM